MRQSKRDERRKRAAPAARATTLRVPSNASFPIVGIGSSAGGLEALEQFLGSAETIGGYTNLFATVNSKSRIFRRKETADRLEPVQFPSSFSSGPAPEPESPPASKPQLSLQSLAEQLVLQRYAPPTVLANDKGDILYISGRTGKYLEPAVGKANWNVFAMTREGLRYELADAFPQIFAANRKCRPARTQGWDRWRRAARGRYGPTSE